MSTSARKIINWFEIPVTDIRNSAALYGAMLDVKLELADFGGVPHAVLPSGDPAVTSGALISDPKRHPRTGGAGTLIYLAAPDGLARCLARAVEAGAKVVQPVTPIDPHGAIAVIEDLDGNHVGLHEEPKAQ